MWRISIMKIFCFLLLFISLNASQGYRYIPAPGPSGPLPSRYDATKLSHIDDVLEYQALLHSCKMIKQNMKAIADHRLLIEDAVETSITLYLEGVKGHVAKILLDDIRKNGFNL